MMDKKDKGTIYFERHELSISNDKNSNNVPFTWKVGMDSSNNLLGTIGLTDIEIVGTNTSGPDLANCCTNPSYPSVFDPKYPLRNGLISRDGWSLIDDSFTELIDNGTGDFDNWFVRDPALCGAIQVYSEFFVDHDRLVHGVHDLRGLFSLLDPVWGDRQPNR